ncbi:hypothetical protein Riv7116_5993 [Rivularia sp. PCC 7116]|uniref:hypothetical protein n=1 Tax=Rivularia sp. PCC 7116 TaxID=373994 RepID=UPI00029EC726|nr:hypothetical protein [Rivularia sp. PCC 7116]AFY58354.1 hypothetical protein Riv7116_5993 [Rivularia sp. PCC 7116]
MEIEFNLKPEEFHDALKKGLGRAYLYVKQYGDSQVRDSILYCCLHNPSYDAQCEEQRAEWLISLIDLTENKNFYFSKIIDALMPSTDCWDTYQLFQLCGILAKRNFKTAKTVIYQKFDLQEFNESCLGGYEIINLDGLTGLRYVIQRLGKRLSEEEDYWDDCDVFDYAYEKLGKVEVSDYLQTASTTDRYIKTYLEQVKNHNIEKPSFSKESYIERVRKKYLLKRVLSNVENKKYNSAYTYTVFGKYAVEAELNLVFEKFLDETRKEQIVRYLWIFRTREVPRLDNKLFQLAMSDDGDIRTAAVATLKFCQDSSIRNLAIDLSKNQDEEIAICSVGLFIKNYQSGDNRFIESILPRINDEDTKHFVCMDLIKIFERHEVDELLTSLLWAYENTPCTHCREKIVKALIASRLIPQRLVDECQFDCVQDVRHLAREYTRA